jgi:hypothetical protein
MRKLRYLGILIFLIGCALWWWYEKKREPSGIATMTTTIIAPGTCGEPVSIVAKDVKPTDGITMSLDKPNTTVLIYSWATSGYVNFRYCNPSTESIAPNPTTLKWAVVRWRN